MSIAEVMIALLILAGGSRTTASAASRARS
jgi:hypothetical protein